MRYVWKYFTDLDRRRANNGYGPLPLQYSEIQAYFDLYKIDYDPAEVYLIEVMDGVAMTHYSEELNKKRQPKKTI